jgi:hypothetical protein
VFRATEFFEQGFRLFQIGGVETFGEPVVDSGEYRAGFVTTASSYQYFLEVAQALACDVLDQ